MFELRTVTIACLAAPRRFVVLEREMIPSLVTRRLSTRSDLRLSREFYQRRRDSDDFSG